MSIQNKRIVVTRATDQSAGLTALLRDNGAVPIAWPVLRTEPLPFDTVMREAIAHADWLVFSSVNGVRYTLPTLREIPGKSWRIAAVGPKTGEAVSSAGFTVTVMPAHFDAATMVQTLIRTQATLAGQRVVVIGGVLSPDDVAHALSTAGAIVSVVTVYRTLATDLPPPSEANVDAFTYASESAVHFAALKLSIHARKSLASVCLGARTARAARAAGMRVVSIAEVHSDQGLLEALKDYFGS